MAVTVYYNNIDLFSGLGITPLISRSVENVYVNKVSHLVDKITLFGRLKKTDCTHGFDVVYSLSRSLCTRLSNGFKQLRIQEDSTSVFSYDYAIVRSVNFSEDKWFDWVPFTIEIDCYDKGYFESNGIIDPQEQFSIETLPDNTLKLTVTTSCKGLNNNSQGIKNAQTFALADVFSPSSLDFYWVEDYANYYFFLTSYEESVNRLTGEASVTKTYVGQHKNFASTYGILTYTREMSMSENGEVIVSISGSEKGAVSSETSLFMVSEDIKTKDWYSIANELYKQYDQSGTLFSNPVKFSVQRNVSNENVSFSISFSNQQNNDVYVIDQTTVTKDFERSINCIEASLEIRSNFGCHSKRWTNVLNYYNSLNFAQYVQDRWNEYGQRGRLDFKENNRSLTENQQEGFISISMTLCDNGGENCGCLQGLEYSFDFEPSLGQHSVSPTFGGEGCYYIERLNAATRAKFSIRGSTSASNCCSIEKTIFQLRNKANQLANVYFPGSDKILELDQISKPDTRGRISFDFAWSADQGIIVPSNLL